MMQTINRTPDVNVTVRRGAMAFDVVEPTIGVRFIQMIINTSQLHRRCMVF